MQIRSIATLALLLDTVAVTGVSLLPLQAQDKAAPSTVMAKIVVTAGGEKDQKPPELKREDVVGAESYFLGYNDPVSFKPCFTDLQNLVDNQYWLALDMKPGTKVALKSINISTEVSGVELVSADSISVPAAK